MEHAEVVLLLSEFVAGRLSSEKAAPVEAHAAACKECREMIDVIRLASEEIRTHGPALFGNHPSTEDLVAYASGPEHLSTTELARIGSHLGTCSSCRDEVDITSGALNNTESWWQKLFARFSMPRLVATPAFQLATAVLFLVMLYPAYLGLTRQPGEPEAGLRGGIPTYLFEAHRPRSHAPTILIGTRQTHVSLLVPHSLDEGPASLTEIPIVATISRFPEGTETWRYEASAADCWAPMVPGANLLVPTDALPPGGYKIVLREAGREEAEYQGWFEITTRDGPSQ